MATTHRDFKRGTRGRDVERFQRALKRRLDERGEDRAANSVKVDGTIGPQTAKATAKALHLLGCLDQTVNAARRGSISMAAQRIIINPKVRVASQRERGRKRMEEERRRDRAAAKRKAGIEKCTRAAKLALAHRSQVHYTQGGMRWQGIARRDVAAQGEYPNYADCSSFYTWCLWQLLGNGRDVVNGLSWRGGFTGTLLTHGKRSDPVEGAAAIYGRGYPGTHVAYCLGNGMVISHGSEAGPFLVPIRYRSDLLAIRRYVD